MKVFDKVPLRRLMEIAKFGRNAREATELDGKISREDR